MRISTRGRYALKIMIDLSLNAKENYVSLTEISKRQGISSKYSEQIISKLNKAGYLKTARGNTGGYMLSKKPDEYKIGDILRATEGTLAPLECISDGFCDKKGGCKSYVFWEGLDKVIEDYVDSKTLEDLIK